MRPINADALKKAFIDGCATECDICTHYLSAGDLDGCHCDLIDNAPTIDARPKGKWIYERPSGKTYSDFVYCSICQKPNGFYKTNFCPNCGADMRSFDENICEVTYDL